MEDALTLLLYLAVIAIVGIVTLIRKVMERASSGADGKKISLAEAVQEQMNRYLKGGPPGRFGGRGFGGEDVKQGAPVPPVRPAMPPMLEKPAPARRKPPQPPRPPLQSARAPAARRLTPLKVKPGIDKSRSLISQSTGPAQVTRSGSQRGQGTVALGRKNLRKAVLLAEILGPPVSERDEYRLF